MLAETPLLIDVAELVRSPGSSKRVELEAQVPGLVAAMGRVADEGAVEARLLLESLVEGILVTGVVAGAFVLECSRCLREFEVPFEVRLHEVFSYPEQPEIEEGFVVEHDTVDLVPMLRDETLLAIPTNPLHDEDCKGLCLQCGQDLNAGDCGHRQEPVDIRWEPLRDLRDRIEGS